MAYPPLGRCAGAWLACLALCGSMAGCLVNAPAPPLDRDVSFSTEIQPILTERCASCHSEGGFAFNVGIPLDLVEGQAYRELVGQPSIQDPAFTLVVPGESENSLLFLKVSENAPPVGSTMPLFSARLSSDELGLFRDWIDQGAADN